MHRAFFVLVLSVSFAAFAQEGGGCTAPPNTLSAWWTFDETSGSVAADRAGAVKNDGTHQGAVTPLGGVVSGAACYDGKSGSTVIADQDEIDFPSHCEVDAGTSYTIDFWIRTDAVTGTHSILDKREYDPVASTIKGYHVYLYKGRIGFQMANGQGVPICGPTGPCINFTSPFYVAGTGWHFVAITVEQGCFTNRGTFYVDGQESSFTPRTSSVDNSANLYIARRTPSLGGQFFRGCLDELEISKRAMSKAELDAIYAAGPYGKCKSKCPADIPPVLAGCLGECGHDPISTQFVVTGGSGATGCSGTCLLRVKLIEPGGLCGTEGVRIVITKNGTEIWNKLYVTDLAGTFTAGYIDVVTGDYVVAGDNIKITAALEEVQDPEFICKREAEMSFEVALIE